MQNILIRQRNEIRTEKGLEKLQKDLLLLKAVVKKLHEETKTGLHRESFNKETFAKIKVMKKVDEIPEIDLEPVLGVGQASVRTEYIASQRHLLRGIHAQVFLRRVVQGHVRR